MPADVGFRRGDLVIAVFGKDYGKPRPGVVIQSDLFNGSHASAVLCPVSSDLTGFTIFRVKLLASTKLDKKVSGGEVKFVLAKRIGKVVWGQRVPHTAIESALTKNGRE